MQHAMKFTLALAAALTIAAPARATLYDLTFSNPPHTAGFPPVVGSGPAVRHSISEIAWGTPEVVTALGALTDQPCRFDSWDGAGDQIKLRLDDLPASDFYSLTADVLVESATTADEFSILFDAPGTRRIDFHADGTVWQWVTGLPIVPLGSYTLGSVVKVRADINLNTDQWTIYLNGAVVFSGDFGSASAIKSIRFSTEVAGIPTGCRAAIDNVIVTEETGGGGCDRLTMSGLTIGDEYAVGDEFMTEGVAISVSEFFDQVGPCAAVARFGSCFVEAGGQACGAGRELHLSNCTLTFDFGGPVSEVVIPYGEYGGTVSLGINGACETVENYIDLDGTSMGGVSISVFDFGVSGQGCGVIRLGGTVESLSLGGQEFYLDALSYCHTCADLVRSAYDNLPGGANYAVGQTFSSGAATHRIRPGVAAGVDCSVLTNGVATVLPALFACGDGKELRLLGVTDQIDFGQPLSWLALAFGDLNGVVSLHINGECTNATALSDLNGQELGGCKIWAIDYDDLEPNCGTLYVVGRIDDFAIGGGQLFLDNVRACPLSSGTTNVEPNALTRGALGLAQNAPNPFSSRTLIRFELPTAGAARVAVHDVAGRLVRTIVSGPLASGPHDALWDGRDDAGRRMPAGLYSYRIEAAGRKLARTMVLLPR